MQIESIEDFKYFPGTGDELVYAARVQFDQAEVRRIAEKHGYVPAFYQAGTNKLPGRMFFVGAGFEDPIIVTLYPETIAALRIQDSEEAVQWIRQRLEDYLAK